MCVSKEDGSRVFSSRTFYSFLLDNILFICRVRFALSLNIGHKITTEYHNEDVFELSSSMKDPKINRSVLFVWFCELSELRNVQQLGSITYGFVSMTTFRYIDFQGKKKKKEEKAYSGLVSRRRTTIQVILYVLYESRCM